MYFSVYRLKNSNPTIFKAYICRACTRTLRFCRIIAQMFFSELKSDYTVTTLIWIFRTV